MSPTGDPRDKPLNPTFEEPTDSSRGGPSSTTAPLAILATIMVGWALYVGADILQPLVIALLLASLLQPIVRLLARFYIPPFVTVVLLVTLLFFGFAQLGIILQANIEAFVSGKMESPATLTPDEQALRESVGGWNGIILSLQEQLAEKGPDSVLTEPLTNSLEELKSGEGKTGLGAVATGIIGGGFGFTKGLVLVVIYMVFIFAEQAIFRRKILAISGERRAETEEMLETIAKGIQRYLGVKTITSFLTGSLCYAMLVALGIPFALLFGFLTFLLNYIPTFGSIIAGLFPTVTAIAMVFGGDASWSTVFGVVITYLAVNLTLGSFIEPRILGRELNISPLVVVISVVVWGGLWGIVGAFLAVPLTVIMQIILFSRESTRPIAIMLSSGPPREERRLSLPRRRRRPDGEVEAS